MAVPQAIISDWVQKVLEVESRALSVFGDYGALAKRAQLLGWVGVDENGQLTTTLTQENLVGTHAEIELQTFLEAFVGLGQIIEMVSDELAAKIMSVTQ